ncbi:MAG: ribosomal RNA small subunit methyltransferase A [Evtepia gabavorous]
MEIVPGDILKTDIAALCRERMPGLPVVACANLPYNITTPVITALLQAQCFQAVTVMIQREVAQRICAQPGTPEYGAFTLLCQYYADCALLYDVPPSCFLPAPKVTSTVIRMTIREEAPAVVEDPDPLFRWSGRHLPRGGRPLSTVCILFWKKVWKADPEWSAPCLQSDGDHSWGAPYFRADFAQLTGKLKKSGEVEGMSLA